MDDEWPFAETLWIAADRRMTENGQPVVFPTSATASAASSILDQSEFPNSGRRDTGLLGRSGSGKTTALKMVNGLLFPICRSKCWSKASATTAWDLIELRRSIGYVIQEVGLFPHFTIERNVGLVPSLEHWPPERIRDARVNCCEQVGLDPADYLTPLSAPAFRRSAAARRRGAGAGGRSKILLCSTSRSARSIPSLAWNCKTNSSNSGALSAKRRSLSPTMCGKPCASGRASDCCIDGKLEVLATPAEFRQGRYPGSARFLAALEEPVV